MSRFETDEEQVEMLKRFWNDYGKAITTAIIIGLLIGFGWKYWSGHQQERRYEASTIYQTMMGAYAAKKVDIAKKYAARLMTDYRNTPYASMADLLWARQAVNDADLPVALEKLQWVIQHAKMKGLRQIARIRAARVLIAQQKPKDALALLATVDEATFAPFIDRTKGDAYLAIGDMAQAQKFYRASKIAMATQGINDPFVDMKLAQ